MLNHSKLKFQAIPTGFQKIWLFLEILQVFSVLTYNAKYERNWIKQLCFYRNETAYNIVFCFEDTAFRPTIDVKI